MRRCSRPRSTSSTAPVPPRLSFGALATATGLAGSTLVQRFGSRAALLRGALGLAWDRLDAATAAADARAPDGADGVVALLVALTGQYDEHDVADQLLVLREDLRDPVLRARGTAWIATLTAAIDRRLGSPPGSGALVVAHWQGTVTVWGFTRRGRLRTVVRRSAVELLDRIGATG